MNQLTEREIEIMNLVTSGFDNQEISKKLCISPSITNAWLSNINHKFDYKNRVNSAINK